MTFPSRRGGSGGGGGGTTVTDALPNFGDTDPNFYRGPMKPRMTLGWTDPSVDPGFPGIKIFTSAPTKV